jgi:hypothetical protein
MDLGTIAQKLDSASAGVHADDSEGYATVQTFVDDTRLVWENALKYNPPGTDAAVMASALSTLFEDQLLEQAPMLDLDQAMVSQLQTQMQVRGWCFSVSVFYWL